LLLNSNLTMTKQEIKTTLIELLSSDNFDSVEGKIQKIANDFMLELKEEERRLEKLQMDIDSEFEVDAENLQINKDIKELIERFKLIRKEIKQEKTKQENENLKQKEQLLKEFQELVINEEHIGKAITKIQEIRVKWNTIGNIPREKYQDIQSEYSRLNDLFSYNIQIFKELKEHDLKKNYSLKNQIIYELTQLANESDIKQMEQQFRKMQNSWNEIGGTYQDKWEDLKTKYWEQVKIINEKIKAHYEALKSEREENLNKKLALIEKAKELTSSVKDSSGNYEKITKSLLELQEDWNKIGAVEKSKKDEIWKQFREVNDTFFTQKAIFFNEKKEEWQRLMLKRNKL
jgi:DNA repair exonuclease SbcCD ATPase subunit